MNRVGRLSSPLFDDDNGDEHSPIGQMAPVGVSPLAQRQIHHPAKSPLPKAPSANNKVSSHVMMDAHLFHVHGATEQQAMSTNADALAASLAAQLEATSGKALAHLSQAQIHKNAGPLQQLCDEYCFYIRLIHQQLTEANQFNGKLLQALEVRRLTNNKLQQRLVNFNERSSSETTGQSNAWIGPLMRDQKIQTDPWRSTAGTSTPTAMAHFQGQIQKANHAIIDLRGECLRWQQECAEKDVRIQRLEMDLRTLSQKVPVASNGDQGSRTYVRVDTPVNGDPRAPVVKRTIFRNPIVSSSSMPQSSSGISSGVRENWTAVQDHSSRSADNSSGLDVDFYNKDMNELVEAMERHQVMETQEDFELMVAQDSPF